MLEWGPGQTLTLTGAYTPWNYQTQDNIDSDMGGSSPVIVNLPTGSSSTTELVVTGGKQGNGYLVDAGNHLNNPGATPADLTKRPPAVNPNQDPSLFDPNANRSYFSPAATWVRLSLFCALISELPQAMTNFAKSRDTPSTFTESGRNVFTSFGQVRRKRLPTSSIPAAPSVVVTKVIASPRPASLFARRSCNQNTASHGSLPGGGMTTGNQDMSNEIYWVVDAGVQRTDGLSFTQRRARRSTAYLSVMTMHAVVEQCLSKVADQRWQVRYAG